MRGGIHCGPGRHVEGCWHGRNLTVTSHTELAHLRYGRDGGKQIRLIRRDLDLATTYAVRYDAWHPERRTYVEWRGHLLSYLGETELPREVAQLASTSGTVILAADPLIHLRMMAGHYQEIPGSLVQLGRGFLVWATALVQQSTARLQVGETARYRVAGRSLHLRPEALAMRSLRLDRRLEAIKRHAERGNAVQDDWEMWLEGEVLMLCRLRDRRQEPSALPASHAGRWPADLPASVTAVLPAEPVSVEPRTGGRTPRRTSRRDSRSAAVTRQQTADEKTEDIYPEDNEQVALRRRAIQLWSQSGGRVPLPTDPAELREWVRTHDG